MKKYLLSAVLSTQLLFSSGIPTVDVLAIAQTLAQNIKEIAEWKETAERWSDTASHYSSQLTAYENELMSKTGIRDSVGFVKDLNRLQQYAKVYGDDYLDLAKAMANPSSNIGNLSRSLFQKYNVFDRCENQIYKDWQKENCKLNLQREVTQIATVQETKKMVDTSAENLEKLSKSINNRLVDTSKYHLQLAYNNKNKDRNYSNGYYKKIFDKDDLMDDSKFTKLKIKTRDLINKPRVCTKEINYLKHH